jgi:hypothetical protein
MRPPGPALTQRVARRPQPTATMNSHCSAAFSRRLDPPPLELSAPESKECPAATFPCVRTASLAAPLVAKMRGRGGGELLEVVAARVPPMSPEEGDAGVYFRFPPAHFDYSNY